MCLYHGHCHDGALGAALVLQRFPGCACFPMWPSHLPWDLPDLTGKAVVVIDVVPEESILRSIARDAGRLLVLDHHTSNKAVLQDVLSPDQYVFSATECGTSLTWMALHGASTTDGMCELAQYVKALDLFDWTCLSGRDPGAIHVSRAIQLLLEPNVPAMLAALTAHDDTLAYLRDNASVVDVMVSRLVAQIRSAGRYKGLVLPSAAGIVSPSHPPLPAAPRHIYPGANTTAGTPASTAASTATATGEQSSAPVHAFVVNSSSLVNWVAHAEYRSPVVVTWWHQKDARVRVCLRSRGGFNCEQFARAASSDGGGHPNAASFTLGSYAALSQLLVDLPPHRARE